MYGTNDGEYVSTWCDIPGPPEVWVINITSHFENCVVGALEKALKLDRRFAVATWPWSYGTCEQVMG